MAQDETEEDWAAGIKPRQRLFLLNYFCNPETWQDGAASYREAYTTKTKTPTQSTCETNSSKMLRGEHPYEKVKDAKRKLLKIIRQDKDEEAAHMILQDVFAAATFNPADILDEDGSLNCSLNELGDKAKFIEQIIPATAHTKTRIVLTDRYKAMTLAMKYLNLVREEQQIAISIPVVEVQPKATGDNAIEAWNKKAEEEN